MKAISILGTNSDAGKSWVTTAICAILHRKGIRVAPFKAQNMSNNSYVTVDGAEIGRAQAVQAEACDLIPTAEINPVLLKPTGDTNSQVVLLGKAQTVLEAKDYYKQLDNVWKVVSGTLDKWKTSCDVLIMEGAGSPVELNLMNRDIVNLEPVRYLDGKWLLVADIERGGVFAQAYGTYKLMPEEDRKRGLGVIVNKFRGDMDLFSDAERCFSEIMNLPYLGTLPMRYDLQPESEDGFINTPYNAKQHGLPLIAWVRMPRISNTQDMQPWLLDEGIQARWVSKVNEINDASIIVLPGTKNTLADLQWLEDRGLADAIRKRAEAGVPVVGICGGFQMLGEVLSDPEGIAGKAGDVKGLSLLPIETIFEEEKVVTQVTALWDDDSWDAYEIHMGRTRFCGGHGHANHLIKIVENGERRNEGVRSNRIWGTYLHGLFESSSVRESLIKEAGISAYRADTVNWREHQKLIYSGMADLVEEYIDLAPLWEYLEA